MSKGRLYIVRNPLFPTLFKIGFTTKGSVEDRGLNASNVPESFEVIREFECDDVEGMEKLFHETYEPYRYYSQLDGRGKKTEFFVIACLANAIAWMDKLKGLTDITEEVEEKVKKIAENEEVLNKNLFDKSKVVRRSVFNFSEMGIPVGAILEFAPDPQIKIKVINNRQIEFKNKIQSFSSITAKLLKLKSSYVRPTPHWTYNGKCLFDIYNETYPYK